MRKKGKGKQRKENHSEKILRTKKAKGKIEEVRKEYYDRNGALDERSEGKKEEKKIKVRKRNIKGLRGGGN